MYAVSGIISGDSESIQASLQKIRSIFCSLDTVVNILVFFSRFFVKADANETRKKTVVSGLSIRRIFMKADANDTRKTAIVSGSSSGANTRSPSILEEEKEEVTCETTGAKEIGTNSSTTIRLRVKDRSIDMPIRVVEEYLPNWVMEEYGLEVETESDTKT